MPQAAWGQPEHAALPELYRDLLARDVGLTRTLRRPSPGESAREASGRESRVGPRARVPQATALAERRLQRPGARVPINPRVPTRAVAAAAQCWADMSRDSDPTHIFRYKSLRNRTCTLQEHCGERNVRKTFVPW